MGSPQNTASTIRLPTNNPPSALAAGYGEPQLNTAHHGRTTTVTYPPPRAPGGVGHQSYGGHSVGETPGPIPNPEAKTHSADGTAPGRVWESRTPPDSTLRKAHPGDRVGLSAFPGSRRAMSRICAGPGRGQVSRARARPGSGRPGMERDSGLDVTCPLPIGQNQRAGERIACSDGTRAARTVSRGR